MTLTVDAGGTYLRARLMEGENPLQNFDVKTALKGLSEWLEEILKAHKGIETICIAYAGQVQDGYIVSSPNIRVDRHDIKEYFESKYGVKLFIDNDLNCAVLAEAKYHNSSDVAALYIGTGIGLGVVSGANLVLGHNSIATELGHIPFKEAPFQCGCGKTNCLELFGSGSAIERWKKVYNLPENVSLQELQESDDIVYCLFQEALLHAAAVSVTLFNPQVLVLGGGVIGSNPYLCRLIEESLSEYALPLAVKNLKIVQSEIDNASLEGALLLKDGDV